MRKTLRGFRMVSAILGTALAVTLVFWSTRILSPAADDEVNNIILIVIDTMRSDHLSCYGYQRPTSPSIDRLAAEGALFENAMSTASFTRAAVGSLFTGLYPSVHGALGYDDSIPGGIPTLAERLGGVGYRTVGYYRNGNVSQIFGFQRGFDVYELPNRKYHEMLWKKGELPKEREDLKAWQLDDRAVTWRAVPFLQEIGPTPFFLYLHLMGPHSPYTPPPDSNPFLEGPMTPNTERFYQLPLKRRDRSLIRKIQFGLEPTDDESEKQMVALYDAEILMSDRQVGEVLDTLDQTGLAENTYVILLSDHGEEFRDHGELNHGHTHYQELLHVPLVIRGPGIHRRRVKEAVSLIDIKPTILEMAGVDVPAELPGQSLLSVVRSRWREPPAKPVYAESLVRLIDGLDPILFRSVQTDEMKLILDFQRRRKMLFDLAEDPGETRNLLRSKRNEGRRLFTELNAIHQENQVSPFLTGPESVEVPEELADNLRALGYVAGKEERPIASESPRFELFRRPLRLLDLEPEGFVGHEREGDRYQSVLNFAEESFPEEQLLYGWSRLVGKGRNMGRRSALRLKREPEHRSWVLRGRTMLEMARPLEVSIRIDDRQPQRRIIRGDGLFEISGELPADIGTFFRIEFECDRDFLKSLGDRTDDYAYCLRVFGFELLEEVTAEPGGPEIIGGVAVT